MAVRIDEMLSAAPSETVLPSGDIQLFQTIHSDFAAGEIATIEYSLDGRNNVMFDTPGGPSKTLVIPDVKVGPDPAPRVDVVKLSEVRGGTGLDTLDIDQEIRGEDRITHDSVTLTILEDP
jgi:hypothetical protein